MGGVAACVFAAGCEANHTHVRELALIRSEARPPQSGEDRTDERAADGLLVVQVCRLGTVSRKVPQAASPLIRRRDDGRVLVSSPQLDDLSRRAMPRRAECRLRAQAWTRAPNRPERGKRPRLKSINKVNADTVIMRG